MCGKGCWMAGEALAHAPSKFPSCLSVTPAYYRASHVGQRNCRERRNSGRSGATYRFDADISATLGHSIAVMRAVYSHPLPKQRRCGTDAIAAALSAGQKVRQGY